MSSPAIHLPALAAEAIGALADTIAALDRMQASIAAHKAELVEQARRLSTTVALVDAPADVNPWGAAEASRRILVAELACALRVPQHTVDSLVSDSEWLVNDLPATFDALAHGRISWQHAHLMADHASTLPVEVRSEFELCVLPHAEAHTAARFNRHARIVRERMHPESIEQRHRSALETRTVDVQPARDGMAWLTALLPATTAHAIFDRVDRAAASARSSGDPRSRGQLRADAFAAAMLDVPIESAAQVDPPATVPQLREVLATIRPHVQITVPVLMLLGHDSEPATLEGYGPIDRETAVWLTAEAPSLTRLLTHPETGAVLSVGRDRYSVPPDLRRWLRTRDGTCRFPGCGTAASRSDIDHTDDWHDGGGTSHDNLAHLCRAHHRLKHLTDWRVEQIGDGRLRWTSPIGTIYETVPDGERVMRAPHARPPRVAATSAA